MKIRSILSMLLALLISLVLKMALSLKCFKEASLKNYLELGTCSRTPLRTVRTLVTALNSV
jgi:hypothetical protein